MVRRSLCGANRCALDDLIGFLRGDWVPGQLDNDLFVLQLHLQRGLEQAVRFGQLALQPLDLELDLLDHGGVLVSQLNLLDGVEAVLLRPLFELDHLFS